MFLKRASSCLLYAYIYVLRQFPFIKMGSETSMNMLPLAPSETEWHLLYVMIAGKSLNSIFFSFLVFKETAGSPTDLLPSDRGITRLDKFPENSASGSMANNQREVLFTVQMTHNFYICERLNKSIHCHVLSTLFCWIQMIYSPFLSQVCMKSAKKERQVFKNYEQCFCILHSTISPARTLECLGR